MSRTLFPISFLSAESLEKNALIEISLDNKNTSSDWTLSKNGFMTEFGDVMTKNLGFEMLERMWKKGNPPTLLVGKLSWSCNCRKQNGGLSEN